MLFNSGEFLLVFLPAVLLGWWVVFRRPAYRLGFLALASYAFYSYFEFPTGLTLLPLMLVSTTADYVAGTYIHRRRREAGEAAQLAAKRALWAALSVNLGMLAFFKYLGFFEGTLNALASVVGLGDGVVPVHQVLLPIGISFYTFNSMSYTIDIWRGRVEPAKSMLEYAAFVALFPHLIAGPIVRYSDIDEQLRTLRPRLTGGLVAVGMTFLICGLFKKVVIANSLAGDVDRLWAASGDLGMIAGWAAAIGYALQLYFDFSAYSDMAVGLALLLGFRFPQNFNSPYKSENIAEFWTRWHMSLSRWLRDYLYIPLGGSRTGKARTLRNLMITMFLGGLWHGAGWVFVIWGLGHGLLLVLHRVLSDAGLTLRWKWCNRALTFLAVVVLWVPFRSGDLELLHAGTSLEVTGQMLGAMFGANGLGLGQLTGFAADAATAVPVALLAYLAALLAFVNIAPNLWELRLRPARSLAFGMAGLAACSVAMLSAPSPFLYFQF